MSFALTLLGDDKIMFSRKEGFKKDCIYELHLLNTVSISSESSDEPEVEWSYNK